MADHPEIIDLVESDMDDDEALRYAIALSLQEQDKPVVKDAKQEATQDTKQEAKQDAKQDTKQDAKSSSHSSEEKPPPSGSAFGSLSLDRKNMEQERLQRIAKRRRQDDQDNDDTVEAPPPKRKATSKEEATPATPATTLPFPKGTVKRTWARGYPRTIHDIKIEEVLQKKKLELAVLCSFQWDDEWIISKLNLTRTKLLLVAFAADEAQRGTMRSNAPPGIRFCFPPMNGPGAMHSKLQLLKYPEYLRIVIPTGNLVPYDWGEPGAMENMVFLIDLPRLTNSTDHRPTPFSNGLGRFLRALGVDDSLISSLANYDFAQTKDLGFVYTIPGGHTGDSQRRVGYCGLGESVASLGLATNDPIEVDLVCASLGSVNYDLIDAIYNACRGDDGMTEYNARTNRKGKAKPSTSPSLKDRFRIYFPTEETVARSRGGRSAGGTICIQPKWWRAPTFPRELVRNCINNRDGLLMHSKLIFVRKSDVNKTAVGQSPGWAYVGSANLSESAWGRLVKDRGTSMPKMSCRNWECGVIIQVPKLGTEAGGQRNKAAHSVMEIFDGTVPIPMKVPGSPYGPSEEPWFFVRT